MYDALHLTEFSRWVDRKQDHLATNAEHQGVLRILCRMVLALQYLNPDRSELSISSTKSESHVRLTGIKRCQFLCLARMILRWKDYLHPNSSRFEAGDSWEQAEELQAAQRLIRLICQSNGISESDIEDECRTKCKEWPRGTGVPVDLSAIQSHP